VVYCFKCPKCGREVESNIREPVPWCACKKMAHPTEMVRDYKAESVQVDKFALRQDVRGNRKHRADPLPPDEAHRVNQERMSR
jgi:hypothetical protein